MKAGALLFAVVVMVASCGHGADTTPSSADRVKANHAAEVYEHAYTVCRDLSEQTYDCSEFDGR